MIKLTGSDGNDKLDGDMGDDVLRGGAGNDTLLGGDGADTLDGEFGNDVLLGGAGDDYLTDNLGGNDSLFGNEGNDTIHVVDLTDEDDGDASRTLVMDGGSGDDLLRLDFGYNLAGSVIMNGGDGNDVIAANGGGTVQIDAGIGNDVVKINAAAGYEDPYYPQDRTTYRITLGAGSDTLSLLNSNDFAWQPYAGEDSEEFGGNAFNTILVTDFVAGAGGDRIDLIGFLHDQFVANTDTNTWDPGTNPFAAGHLRLVQLGTDAVLQGRVTYYDYIANRETTEYRAVVTLEGVNVTSLTAENLGGFDPAGLVSAGANVAGTSGNDLLVGLSGSDQISGGTGGDVLRGGSGNDTLFGGDGADTIDGEFGNDLLLGGAGNDYLTDNLGGNDSLFGNEGDDTIRVIDLTDEGNASRTLVMDGGSGDDLLHLDFGYNLAGSVIMNGGDGNDVIAANGGGTVQIDAGIGNDVVKINAAAGYEDPYYPQDRTTYRITLGAGSDTLSLLNSNDFAWQPYAREDSEEFGGNAFNTILVTDFVAGAGGDRIDLIGFLHDQFVANTDTNTWDPGTNPFAAGHLRLVQLGTDAVLQGRVTYYDYIANRETTEYRAVVTLEGVNVTSLTAENLGGFDPAGLVSAGANVAGTSGNDLLVGLSGSDQISGGTGGDVLRGGSGNDTLFGGDGADTIDGEFGNDLLLGGAGNDYLTDNLGGNDSLFGNEGDDTIRVIDLTDEGNASRTLVMDGGSGDDLLHLDFGYNLAGSVIMNGGDGNDVIAANGGGTVQIDAGIGNDVVKINAAAGYEDPYYPQDRTTYRITLGAGSDTLSLLNSNDFAWQPYAREDSEEFGGNAFNTILVTDFVAGAGGDRIDLIGFLHDQFVANTDTNTWDPGANPFAAGHLRLVQLGTDAVLQGRVTYYDYIANRETTEYRAVVTLEGVNVTSLTAENLGGFSAAAQGGYSYFGTAGDDSFTGSLGDDFFLPASGNDFIDGGRGHDTIRLSFAQAQSSATYAFSPNATVLTSEGSKTFVNVEAAEIWGSMFADTLTGGNGDDVLFGNLGDDVLRGVGGDDILHGTSQGNLVLDGGAGIDTAILAFAHAGPAVNYVFSGNTTVTTGNGLKTLIDVEAVRVFAGNLSDRLTGGDGNDQFTGNAGNDDLRGLGGDDLLNGNIGNDFLLGGDGSDRLDGGEGDDILFGGTTLDSAFEPNDGDDLLSGSFGNDLLRGGSGNDTLLGGFGDDNLRGDIGDDILDGGEGFDVVRYRFDDSGVTAGIFFDARVFAAKTEFTFSDGRGGIDTIKNVECFGIAGSAFDDVIWGSEHVNGTAGDTYANHLLGRNGNDAIFGASQNDFLSGEDGADTLEGRGGSDILDGGDGLDTALYSGLFRSYQVEHNGALGTVAGGAEGGTDTLTSIEIIQFRDGKFVFDANGVAAQVMRLYDTVLQRAPDQVGLDYYADFLEDEGGTLKQVATGFLNSPEFQAATGSLSNSAYVEFLYQHALGRASDAAGMDYYVSRLESGELDRADLLVGFSESPEHRGQTAALVDQGFFNTDDDYQAVALLYDTFAGRRPDAAGLIYYVDLIKSGTLTLDQIADNFANSPEFRGLTDGMTNNQLINFMYENTLERPAEAAGLAYWNDRLNAGIDRGDLLLGFSQSNEHFVLLGDHVTNGIDYL